MILCLQAARSSFKKIKRLEKSRIDKSNIGPTWPGGDEPDKTKYIVLTRRTRDDSDLGDGRLCISTSDRFQKYLGANTNQRDIVCIYDETELRTISVIAKVLMCFGSFLRPVLTYACETWSTTSEDEEKLARFKRRVLRRISGPILEGNVYGRRTNEEVQRLDEKHEGVPH